PRLSARAIKAPPCIIPNRLLRSSRATSSAVTRSGDTCVILRPRNSAKGGCLWAASFICVCYQPARKQQGLGPKVRALTLQSCVQSAARLWHDANIWARRLEALWPNLLGFVVAD